MSSKIIPSTTKSPVTNSVYPVTKHLLTLTNQGCRVDFKQQISIRSIRKLAHYKLLVQIPLFILHMLVEGHGIVHIALFVGKIKPKFGLFRTKSGNDRINTRIRDGSRR